MSCIATVLYHMETYQRKRFEAEMVVKMVRYLRQQGYESAKMTVLVPYMAQLRELRNALQIANDPVLNDLDLYELAQASLPADPTPPSKKPKNQIQLSTIGMVFVSA